MGTRDREKYVKNPPPGRYVILYRSKCYILSKIGGNEKSLAKIKTSGHEASLQHLTSSCPVDVRIRWTTACVHIGWTTGCVHPVGHLMSASALQPHASIRVPTASATSGGPLDVATSGGPPPPVAHWW